MKRDAKKSRKQYLNDFSPALNGDYVYTGGYYRPEMEDAVFSRCRIRFIIAVIISVMFVFAAGLLPAAGSTNCFYVILPFLAMIICCFVKTGKAVRLFLSGSRIREYTYLKTVPVLPGWIIAEAVSAAATLLAEAVFLLINGVESRELYTVLYICLIVSTMIADLAAMKYFRRISWTEDVPE
ncbi:MAG: hypothetical protein K5771_00230 [Oscillospiraceae bacterium]|nr:hypothetical protein [Oscillospiraceae bacterium]